MERGRDRNQNFKNLGRKLKSSQTFEPELRLRKVTPVKTGALTLFAQLIEIKSAKAALQSGRIHMLIFFCRSLLH